MAADGIKRFDCQDEDLEEDLYAVLGLPRDCSEGDLRAAYKKLALRWHPDRCSAKDSKSKFQAIQEAYSVLSDSNKRMMYDFGMYDDDQIDDVDSQYGMCDFLGEMAAMMQQNKPTGNTEQSFEELQELFLDMLDGGNDCAGPAISGDASFGAVVDDAGDDDEEDFILRFASTPVASCSSSSSYFDRSFASSKRGYVACEPAAADIAAGLCDIFDSVANAFGAGPTASDSGRSTSYSTSTAAAAADGGMGYGARRVGRKQKVSFDQDVSSVTADGVPAGS